MLHEAMELLDRFYALHDRAAVYESPRYDPAALDTVSRQILPLVLDRIFRHNSLLERLTHGAKSVVVRSYRTPTPRRPAIRTVLDVERSDFPVQSSRELGGFSLSYFDRIQAR